jgi:Dolichyl-phosphate-mannose-protein mannosyltransferase
MPQVRARDAPTSTWRPRLLPTQGWARAALLLLLVFTLARGLLWASTQPGWLAPDEDYHWLYTEHLLIERSLPDLNRPFATPELNAATTLTHQGDYVGHRRSRYPGGPRTSLRRLERWVAPRGVSARLATGERPRQVLHPPLYHLGAALTDHFVTAQPAQVRLTAMRYYGAVLGVAVVFFAWLLASQVLPGPAAQLAAAAVVATQPKLAFASGVMGNDILAAVAFTAVLAWCAFMLRGAPSSGHGVGLGILLAVALWSKASMLVLIPIAALALWLAWRSHPGSGRSVRRATAWASVLTVGLAGGWYIYALHATGSPLGTKGELTGPVSPRLPIASATAGPLDLDAAWHWLKETYLTYWIHQFPFEVGASAWNILPLAVGLVGIVGLGRFAWSARHSVLYPSRPAARQALVLATAPLVLVVPFFALDMRRASRNVPFLVADGRFFLPAFAAAAVLLMLGIEALAGGRRRARMAAVGGVVVAAFVNYVHVYAVWGLERYYGSRSVSTVLRHATWDKPEWVTTTSLWALIVLSGAAFCAFVLVAWAGARGERRVPSPVAVRHGHPADKTLEVDSRSGLG